MNQILLPDAVVDLRHNEVQFPDVRRCALTRMESALLAYLRDHADRPVSRVELLAEVWHLNPGRVQTRTVEMHVATLRKKLGDDSRDPRWLITVPHQGYRLLGTSGEQA